MLYVFAIYVVASLCVLGYAIWAILETEDKCKAEREKLVVQIMAMAKDHDAVAVSNAAFQELEEVQGEVKYVDEAKEAALQRSMNR